ncbi:hypothetical protein B0H11DRAFT_1905782 [Mycena galericulata]|nr:hypothetical protein B0H11DRAFT_1905782 [Mycena galericulata]
MSGENSGILGQTSPFIHRPDGTIIRGDAGGNVLFSADAMKILRKMELDRMERNRKRRERREAEEENVSDDEEDELSPFLMVVPSDTSPPSKLLFDDHAEIKHFMMTGRTRARKWGERAFIIHCLAMPLPPKEADANATVRSLAGLENGSRTCAGRDSRRNFHGSSAGLGTQGRTRKYTDPRELSRTQERGNLRRPGLGPKPPRESGRTRHAG